MKQIIIVAFVMALTTGCSQNATSTNRNAEGRPPQGERGGPPSIDEIFKMDANKDGKLSKDEIKGPLQRDFAKIDTNEDGFISREELENAPKPPRGQRPPGNN